MTLKGLKESIDQLNIQLKYGCGNYGCVINPPKGQHTNSICRCTPRQIAQNLQRLAKEIENLNRDWK